MDTKLTKQAIDEAVVKDKPYDVRFRYSMQLRVQPSGLKTLYCTPRRGQRVRLGDATVLTVAQAETAARTLLNEIQPAGEKAIPKSTLGGFVEVVYTPWSQVHRSDSNKVVKSLTRCFKEWWGTRLSDITQRDLSLHVTKRLRKVRDATVRRDLNDLQGVFALAEEEGYLVRNGSPFHGWKDHPTPKDDIITRYLSPDEEAKLRTVLHVRDERARSERITGNVARVKNGRAPLPEITGTYCDHLTPMVLVSLATGLRYGEASKLEWSALDLVNKYPTVTVLSKTSKAEKKRVVPLNRDAVAVLTKWKAQQPKGVKGIVFPNPDGSRIGSVKTAWNKVAADAKLEDFRWTDLRHSFASAVLQAGGTLAEVQQLLGHSDIKLTLRYAHLAPNALSNAVARIERAPAPAVPPPSNVVNLRRRA